MRCAGRWNEVEFHRQKEAASHMTISPDIRKRLLYGKYLLSRARTAQTDQNELGVVVSLLPMHDASELVMLAAADHLQLGAKWSYMEFWEKVKQSGRKEPGHRIPMDQLNTLRVGFKHKGTLPVCDRNAFAWRSG